MRGRKLILEAFKPHAHLQRQGFGQLDDGGGLEVLPGTVGGRSHTRPGRQRVQRITVPLLVIAFELEAQVHLIGTEVLVFVARRNARKALVQSVAVAGQSEKERVLPYRKTYR